MFMPGSHTPLELQVLSISTMNHFSFLSDIFTSNDPIEHFQNIKSADLECLCVNVTITHTPFQIFFIV